MAVIHYSYIYKSTRHIYAIRTYQYIKRHAEYSEDYLKTNDHNFERIERRGKEIPGWLYRPSLSEYHTGTSFSNANATKLNTVP